MKNSKLADVAKKLKRPLMIFVASVAIQILASVLLPLAFWPWSPVPDDQAHNVMAVIFLLLTTFLWTRTALALVIAFLCDRYYKMKDVAVFIALCLNVMVTVLFWPDF